MKDLKVGSPIFKMSYNRNGGLRSVVVNEFVIAGETNTRLKLGRKQGDTIIPLATQLLKKDLSVYGGGYGGEEYHTSIPEIAIEIQAEMAFRSDARILIDSFAGDNKRGLKEDNAELVEVLAVLRKYRNEDGTLRG